MKTSLRPTTTPSPQRLPRPRVGDRPYPGQHPRRQFLRLAVGAAALPAVSRNAFAQSYPSRPITMIVPFAVGGTGDTIARGDRPQHGKIARAEHRHRKRGAKRTGASVKAGLPRCQ
jgi:hypothetical protein